MENTLKTADVIRMVQSHAKEVEQRKQKERQIAKAREYSRQCKRKAICLFIIKAIAIAVVLAVVTLALGVVGEFDRQAAMWNSASITTETVWEV